MTGRRAMAGFSVMAAAVAGCYKGGAIRTTWVDGKPRVAANAHVGVAGPLHEDRDPRGLWLASDLGLLIGAIDGGPAFGMSSRFPSYIWMGEDWGFQAGLVFSALGLAAHSGHVGVELHVGVLRVVSEDGYVRRTIGGDLTLGRAWSIVGDREHAAWTIGFAASFDSFDLELPGPKPQPRDPFTRSSQAPR